MKKLIIENFAKSWQLLDPELIISHLSKSFIYNSQWVSETLDYNEYVEYLKCKFEVLKKNGTGPKVKIVDDDLWGGEMLTLSTDSTTAYYRIRIDGGKVYWGWLSNN